VTPGATTGSGAVADPFGSFNLQASDTIGSCAPGTSGGHGTTIDATATISAGIYCGGLLIKKATTTVTMLPGIYVIKGGGFFVQDAALTGTGVTIINLNGPGATGASDFDVIDITSGNMSLSAPTTGNTAGILIYSPRNQGLSTKAPQKNRIHSDASVTTLGGSIYLPDQEISLESGFSWNLYGGLIANDIRMAGGTLNIDPMLGPVPPSGLTRATIVQ
jgi:hypothetical protein